MTQAGPHDYLTEPRTTDPSYTEGVMDQVNQLGKRAQTLAGDLATAVKDRPYTTLAVAAGLAFAMGALWKLGQQRPQTRLEALQAQMPDLRSRLRDLPRWEDMRRRWWR